MRCLCLLFNHYSIRQLTKSRTFYGIVSTTRYQHFNKNTVFTVARYSFCFDFTDFTDAEKCKDSKILINGLRCADFMKTYGTGVCNIDQNVKNYCCKSCSIAGMLFINNFLGFVSHI